MIEELVVDTAALVWVLIPLAVSGFILDYAISHSRLIRRFFEKVFDIDLE